MFAGIGTDSLRLAKCAGLVISTEINPDTFQCLKRNTSIAKIQNIEIHNLDCFYAKGKIGVPDVIYFDPPWGTSFKTGQPFSFDEIYLGNGQRIPDLFTITRECYPDASFIIKMPFMCDFEKYIQESDIKCILTFSRQKLKYILI